MLFIVFISLFLSCLTARRRTPHSRSPAGADSAPRVAVLFRRPGGCRARASPGAGFEGCIALVDFRVGEGLRPNLTRAAWDLPSSQFHICYYHQDLHQELFHPGSHQELRHKPPCSPTHCPPRTFEWTEVENKDPPRAKTPGP